MASVLRVPGARAPVVPAGDPAQRRQGAIFLSYERAPPPAAWTDNRLAQSQHYTGTIFLALMRVQQAMSSAAAWCERRKRRDRTTFGPGGATAVVKAVTANGGAGNDEDYAPVHDHPIAEIIQRPNRQETFGSLLGYMTLQWGLTGNGPLWLVPGLEHGRPVELYPLVEALMQPAYAPSLQYPEGAWRVTPYYPTGTSWTYGTLGSRMLSSTLLPGTEVRKVMNPHPLLRNDGYSPLTACGVQLDIMEAIDLSRHSAFAQGAQLGTVINIPGLDEPSNERVSAQFRQNYGGANNARKVAVVSSPAGSTGEFKIEQMGESPREMDYGTTWQQAVDFVMATFGVPSVIAGLKQASSYAEWYAAQVQLHDSLSQTVKGFADFFTHNLARPWCKRPGEYRVKIQLPKPRNEDQYVQNVQSLAAQGGCSINEQRAVLDLKPIRFGDLPASLYLKKVEQLEFPQPVGPDPNDPSAAGDPNATIDPNAPPEEQQQDDSPEGVQDATTAAALAALGVPDESPEEDEVNDQETEPESDESEPDEDGGATLGKAVTVTKPGASHPKRNEGEKWSVGAKWYTKKNGKIEEIGDPSKQRAAAGPPSLKAGHVRLYHGGGETPSGGRWVSGDKAYAQGYADKSPGARLHYVDLPHDHPEVKDKLDQAEYEVGKRDIKYAPHFELSAGAARGLRPHDDAGAQQGQRDGASDAIAQKLLAGRPSLRLLGPDLKGHTITDGASLKAFIAKGGKLPDAHLIETAKTVPSTPVAQQTLSKVDQWAHAQATKHADRVAAHFGVSREKAQRILADAIKQIAQHAAKNGGSASGTITGPGGKTVKIGAKRPQGPTGGAPPKPATPAGKGSLPPRGSIPKARDPNKPYKFSSTDVELPKPIATRIRMLAASIPDADLADDGREDRPHVTVRYGLHGDDPAEVAPLVAGGPVALRLGAVTVFPGAVTGKDYDVLKVDVESPDLHRLNATLAELPHTQSFPEYHPHATIAYVRAGLGDEYARLMGRLDTDVTADRIVFSDTSRRRTRIPLADLPTAAVDLDATLARYDGWQGHEHFGEPLEGAREFLDQLSRTHRVLIFTTRTKADDPALGRDDASAQDLADLVRDWMQEHDLHFDDVYTGQGKPLAEVYIDDRAVPVPPNPVPGDYLGVLEAVKRRSLVKARAFEPTAYAKAIAAEVVP